MGDELLRERMAGAARRALTAGVTAWTFALQCGGPGRGRVPRTGVRGERSAHGELVVQAAHGAVADVHVEAARFDGELSLVVVEAKAG